MSFVYKCKSQALRFDDEGIGAMENNCDQTELGAFGSEISDEALEIAAANSADKAWANIIMYYCAALYFCPGPYRSFWRNEKRPTRFVGPKRSFCDCRHSATRYQAYSASIRSGIWAAQ